VSGVLLAGVAVFAAVAVAVALCSMRPRWRSRTVVVAPLVLAAACAVASVALLLRPRPAATGSAAAQEGWSAAWGGVAGLGWAAPALVATAALAVLAFRAEGALVGYVARRPARRIPAGALPPELMAADLPTRAETMDDVAETARSAPRYWTLSVVTVLAEEAFFRVAAPVALLTAGEPLAVALLLPAALYALNHIGFGMASVLGKLLLGIVLGAGAWAAGALLVSVPVHLMYQAMVRRQFVPARPRRSPLAVPRP